MDVKEVAAYMGFSPTKIYRMLTSGEIPHIKVGGQYRFPKAVIDDWLAGKLEVPAVGKATRATKTTRTTQSVAGKEVRVEDEIVAHLAAFNKTGAAAERKQAKKVMTLNMDKLDWQYLAGRAQEAGALDEAITVEKEINQGG